MVVALVSLGESPSSSELEGLPSALYGEMYLWSSDDVMMMQLGNSLVVKPLLMKPLLMKPLSFSIAVHMSVLPASLDTSRDEYMTSKLQISRLPRLLLIVCA